LPTEAIACHYNRLSKCFRHIKTTSTEILSKFSSLCKFFKIRTSDVLIFRTGHELLIRFAHNLSRKVFESPAVTKKPDMESDFLVTARRTGLGHEYFCKQNFLDPASLAFRHCSGFRVPTKRAQARFFRRARKNRHKPVFSNCAADGTRTRNLPRALLPLFS
jgi:hypothetical protein